MSRPLTLFTAASQLTLGTGTSCPKTLTQVYICDRKIWKLFSHVETGEIRQNVINSSVQHLISLIFAIHVSFKNRTEPWMNNEILENIRHRDYLLYTFKKDRSNRNMYKEFCQHRNKIQRDVRMAKAEYFSSKIEENKNDSKKLWQQLIYANNLLSVK